MNNLGIAAQNSELWQTTFVWLRACGYRLSKNYCKEEITTHPDYPSLTSVIDFLQILKIPCRAIKVDISYIHDFDYPVLAHIKQPANERMSIIYDIPQWDREEEIKKYWSGVVVFSKKNPEWEKKENTAYRRNELRNEIVACAFAIIVCSLYLISLLQHRPLSECIFGAFSLLGIFISFLALTEELELQISISRQICGAGDYRGCGAVLKSSCSKGVAGITPADASLTYFTAQFIIYLFNHFLNFFMLASYLISFSSIVLIPWSLFIQAFKLKQWCTLCLIILAILTIQSAIAIFSLSPVESFLPEVVFLTSFCFLMLTLIPIKQLVNTNNEKRVRLAELKKWKFDASLFLGQWRQEEEVDVTIWENDLVLGNPEAALQITVACNPYCHPCAKAHMQLEDLMHRFESKIKVQLRFLCYPEESNSKITIAVKAILQRATSLKNGLELETMLGNWFEWLHYDKWVQNWAPDTGIDVAKMLVMHANWIKRNRISFTPTFFINGRRLPGLYTIKDVEILIPQLSELIMEEAVK